MNIGPRNLDNQLFFVIEEGQFNLGDFSRAILMIEMAAKTGANAIEFQLAYADDFYIRSEAMHSVYKQREFSDTQLQDLVRHTQRSGLCFVATCLSHKLVVKMANFGADAFNINASDINNPGIIDEVVETGKPFFISTPLATIAEIDWAVARIHKLAPAAEYAILHGQHPMASGHDKVEIADTALGFITAAKAKYRRPIGFIDHTDEISMPAVAVAAGARVITKHMTLSGLFEGPDNGICLDPVQMKQAVSRARDVFASISVVDKQFAKGEDLDRSLMRRSLVTANPIAKGSVLQSSDLLFKRPGTGISPDQVEMVIGKKAVEDIPADVLLKPNMFE